MGLQPLVLCFNDFHLWYEKFGEIDFPPFSKGGVGGILGNLLKIPLNPPLRKGDLKTRYSEHLTK
jgi:hypothetical protein